MRPNYILLFCVLFLTARNSYSQSSVEFIENKGQWGSWFNYKAKTAGGEVFFEKDGFRFLLCDEQNVPKMDSFHHGQITKKPTMKFHVYKMSLEGANTPKIEGLRRQKHYYNYFIGNDPEKWKSDIHPCLGLDYKNVYDGIDMHITSERGQIIYDFVVNPNTDVSKIKMNFAGPEKMVIRDGDLIIYTSVGQVMELKPYVYQYVNDTKVEVACKYRLKNKQITFDFPDDYDHTKTLIIDPTITFWSSFTGSTADNWGFTATYDAAGNFYMGGLVNALAIAGGGSFPVSPGAYQSVFAGGTGASAIEYGADLGIMKLSPDGTTRIYATYVGGALNERPHSMIVDNTGNLIIAGKTRSYNYPVTPGAFQPSHAGGWDMFVTKLNATGTALVGSTFVGGTGDDGNNFDSTEVGYGHLKYNYGDDARSEVQIDNVGNIYVAGCTQSTNFPTTSTALATTLAGLQDGVAFKMNGTCTTMLWSTYLRGAADDAAYVLTFNKSQSAMYIAGGTSSTDFPVTPGTWQSSYQGDSADGFILKIRNSLPYNVIRGTYVGTSRYDQVYGIQTDDTGNVYVMGQSLGGTFPVSPGTYNNPSSSQFVMKIDSNLTNRMISTVYGSSDPLHTNISPVAFLVDTCNNIYISGWGGNIMGSMAPGLAHSGTTTGMPVTSDGFDTTTDGYDFYFIVFGPGMSTLRYATFYGRNAPGFSGEHVDGGTSRFDKKGVIYQAICANCGGPSTPPFPTTAGVWAPTSMSGNCNEAALKIAFNIGPVETHVTAGPTTSGCAPLTVNFYNTTVNGISFVWNFGDGSSTTTAFAPTHTFTAAGVYTVMLTAANSTACFKTDDTAYIVITVDTAYIDPGFTYVITDSCGPFAATFTNTSTTNITTGGPPSYTWYFGDGGTFSGANPGSHSYPDTGTYTVMLVMSHPNACKTPDTVIQTLHLQALKVSGTAVLPDSICVGQPFTATGTAINATTVTWTFGDGKTSNVISPVQTYTAPGIYTITFVVENPGACKKSDTLTKVIKVISTPFADFTFVPLKPETNVPTTFTNQSLNAVRYYWDFGDNTSSTEVHPVHQYNKTGTYKACLTAYNGSNCPAIACKEVPAEVQPIIGLPTAFTPNGDGSNDILYVRGAAIKTLDLKIYNRWGQLVFHSTSKDIGWDGTFNNQPQPIEAYGYVLNASFIDGSAQLLKGNITLLR